MTAALQYTHDDRTLVTGQVLAREGDTLSVSLDSDTSVAGPRPVHQTTARRAASCLLAPEPGDRVLVALVPEPFVLAVLERTGSRRAEVVFPGDAAIQASGRLQLGAHAGVSVSSGRELALFSRVLDVKAADGKLAFERLFAATQAAQGHFGKLSVFAAAYERVADRIVERAKRVFRFVEEVDQLRARHFDYRAEQTAQVKGETTVVTARQVVKVDGEQVHIG